MIELISSGADGIESVWPLTSTQSLVVGRAPGCDVCIPDPFLSSKHLLLDVRADKVVAFDTSRNGTLVDGELVVEQPFDLLPGTRFTCGRTVFRLRLVGEAANETEAAKQSEAEHQTDSDELAEPVLRRVKKKPAEPVSPAVAQGSAAAAAKQEAFPNVQNKPEPPIRVVPEPPEQPVAIADGWHVTADEAAEQRDLRREAHRQLLQSMEIGQDDLVNMGAVELRPRVLTALRHIVRRLMGRDADDTKVNKLVGELTDEALGLGPLESLLADPEVTEIMVVDPDTIFVETGGRCIRSPISFTDDERVRAVVERIVTPLGRRIDEFSPLVDARLEDGSRVNAVIRPLALRGTCITIRKFPSTKPTMESLFNWGSLNAAMGRFLTRSVQAKKNIVVSGGTGSGKTTLLNVISAAIPDDERIVTIEDSAELQLSQDHVVSLETRSANLEGQGAYTIRDLVKNALRMRPDRIIVGECRGGEALDMLQAMNTGHEGSLTTVHSNSPKEAIGRLETLCLMAGIDLPIAAIREQIASSVHLIVQQARLQDGSRKVTAISELGGIDRSGRILMRDIYGLTQLGVAADGKVDSRFQATGYLPSYLGEFVRRGLIPKGEPFI